MRELAHLAAPLILERNVVVVAEALIGLLASAAGLAWR
jgi:hypothetical protein